MLLLGKTGFYYDEFCFPVKSRRLNIMECNFLSSENTLLERDFRVILLLFFPLVAELECKENS